MQSKKIHINRLYKILGINSNQEATVVARELGVRKAELQYFNDERILPMGEVREMINS